MKNIIVSLAASALVLGGATAIKLSEQKEVKAAQAEAVQTFNADIRGGARMTYGAGTNTGFTWVNQIMMNQATSGEGIYVRMRNYTGVDTPIAVQVCDNGEGGGGCWSIETADLNYYTYDNQGENEAVCTYRYNTMIVLSPYFDGIVYLPFDNYTHNDWGLPRTSINKSLIWKLMFGLQPVYNSYADYSIGDAFTAEHLNFDSSELKTNELFAAHFTTENYSDGTITATQELFTDFNPVDKDLLGGEMIKTTTSDNYQGPTADIVAMERGIFGGGFFMRVRNYTADIWATLQVMGCEGSVCLPKANKPFLYYGVDGVYANTINGNEYNGFCIPANFDGFIYAPLSSLYNSVNGTPDRYDWLWGIFVTVDAKSFPDRVVVFGDVFSATNFNLRDTSATTHATFAALRNTNQFGKVCHYPGFTDDGATEWAEYFLTETYPCNTAAAGAWSDMASEFNSLSADDQALLVEAVYVGLSESQKNTVEKAMERYDLAVKVQSLNNFISARTPLAANSVNVLKINNAPASIIVVICATVVTLSVAAFFFIRKRKEQ